MIVYKIKHRKTNLFYISTDYHGTAFFNNIGKVFTGKKSEVEGKVTEIEYSIKDSIRIHKKYNPANTAKLQDLLSELNQLTIIKYKLVEIK